MCSSDLAYKRFGATLGTGHTLSTAVNFQLEYHLEQITATSDVMTQDKLRKEKAKEIAAIKKSYVEFKGGKTGWDVSIIDDQFARPASSNRAFWDLQDAAVKALTANAGEIATFLSGANPNLPKDTVMGLLMAHAAHHLTQFQQLKDGEYAREAETWKGMKQHIYVVSDALTQALAAQFPAKF